MYHEVHETRRACTTLCVRRRRTVFSVWISIFSPVWPVNDETRRATLGVAPVATAMAAFVDCCCRDALLHDARRWPTRG